MNNQPHGRFVADLVNAHGRGNRISRYRRIKPWFNGMLYVVPVLGAAVGLFVGVGPYAGLFLIALVLPLTIYVDLYIELMAAFEAAGIDFADQPRHGEGAEQIVPADSDGQLR